MQVYFSRRRLLALLAGLTAGGIATHGSTAALQASTKPKKRIKPRPPCPEGHLYSSKYKKCVEIVPAEPGCFLTTACCDEIGLPDDCFELETLRLFRDSFLADSISGQEKIVRYYILAPQILGRIPKEHRSIVLRILYARYIVPSVIWIKLRQPQHAARVYSRGMQQLMAAFTPDLLPDNTSALGEQQSPALEG